MPKQLEHYDAWTVEEAINRLRSNGGEAQIIAGGVDVVSLMRAAVRVPRVLINIMKIPGLAEIEEDSGMLRIGALASINDIETSSVIKDKFSLLAEAAHSVAAPQIRNMATLGGNLCQQVWCWYYRRSPITGHTYFCRRKGGKQCYAVGGNNTYHAIIGEKECYAASPSDMAPALIALGARLKIAGPGGYKLLPLGEFFTYLGNTLKTDEMITEIQVPSTKPGTRQRFLKFRQRKSIDFALVSVAAAITTERGKVSDARIVLGGVAPTPYSAVKAEAFIKGKALTQSIAEEAAKAALSEAKPLSMNAYKLPIAETLIKRAILD